MDDKKYQEFLARRKKEELEAHEEEIRRRRAVNVARQDAQFALLPEKERKLLEQQVRARDADVAAMAAINDRFERQRNRDENLRAQELAALQREEHFRQQEEDRNNPPPVPYVRPEILEQERKAAEYKAKMNREDEVRAKAANEQEAAARQKIAAEQAAKEEADRLNFEIENAGRVIMPHPDDVMWGRDIAAQRHARRVLGPGFNARGPLNDFNLHVPPPPPVNRFPPPENRFPPPENRFPPPAIRPPPENRPLPEFPPPFPEFNADNARIRADDLIGNVGPIHDIDPALYTARDELAKSIRALGLSINVSGLDKLIYIILDEPDDLPGFHAGKHLGFNIYHKPPNFQSAFRAAVDAFRAAAARVDAAHAAANVAIANAFHALAPAAVNAFHAPAAPVMPSAAHGASRRPYNPDENPGQSTPNIVTIELENYPQFKKFEAFMDKTKKPKYWVSPFFINYQLGNTLNSLMNNIRIPSSSARYIKELTNGGFKRVFNFLIPINTTASHRPANFIIKFESLSKADMLNVWCRNGNSHCSFLPCPFKSDLYTDNYNVGQSKNLCILKTPSPIVESFFSLLNTKYYNNGVSPCLLRTFLSSIINDEECSRKDIDCLKNSINTDQYSACIKTTCNNVPKFMNFYVENGKKFNIDEGNRPEDNVDGRYALTIQEKIDGDLGMYRKAENFPEGLNFTSFCSIFAHICLTFYILQVKNSFMHNDMWFRNIFFIKSNTNRAYLDKSDIGANGKPTVKNLADIDYFKYKINDEYIYIKKTTILPIVSDFGFSEFITKDGEYVYNADHGHRGPPESGLNKYYWCHDIVLFLTSILHIIINNTDVFIAGEKFVFNNISAMFNSIQIAIYNQTYHTDPPHKSIITIIMLILHSIYSGVSINDILTTNRAIMNSTPDYLYRQFNNQYWPTYYQSRHGTVISFEQWITHGSKGTRLNYVTFQTPQWLIKKDWFTLLPLILDFCGIFNRENSFIFNQDNFQRNRAQLDGQHILNINFDGPIQPRFTSKIEPTLIQYQDIMRRSFKSPPNISIDGQNYGGPTYIKTIDTNTPDANVIYYSYDKTMPFLSNNNTLRNQNIHLIVIKNPSTTSDTRKINNSINFNREELIKTLVGIFTPPDQSGSNIIDNEVDYIKTNWGVAFSGAFFKHIDYIDPLHWTHCNQVPENQIERTKCFESIGYIRNPDNPNEKFNPIPELYRDIYGSLCVNQDGNISVTKPILSNDTNPSCRYVLTSGPILVQDSRIFFDADKFSNPRYNTIITPNITPTNSDGNVMFLAGWLNHAVNTNPRAALGIDAAGNIYLVSVEGRQERGTGCDLAILAKIMSSFGCTSAINLDGGGTADLLYKLPNSACYIQTNPSHMYKYPSMSLNNTTSFKFTGPPIPRRGGNHKITKKNKIETKKNKKSKTNNYKKSASKHKNKSHKIMSNLHNTSKTNSLNKHTSFKNEDEFHNYNIKHNKEYIKMVSSYEHNKKAYINKPITDIDIHDIYIFDKDKLIKEVKRIRKQEYETNFKHPKVIMFYRLNEDQ